MQANTNLVSKEWQIMTLKADNKQGSRKSELKIIDLLGNIVA